METTFSDCKREAGEPLLGGQFGWEQSGAPRAVDRAWHTLLSEHIYSTEAMERLLDLARRGYARQLRGQPQRQVDAVTCIDAMARDNVQHGAAMFEYVHQNFGDLAPARMRRWLLFECLVEGLMPIIGVLFALRPTLALLLIQCYKKVEAHYFDALARAARRLNRPGLARLADLIREDHERHLAGMADLVAVLPLEHAGDRLLARLLVSWWHADVVSLLEGPADPQASRAHRTIDFDVPGYRTRVEHVHQQALASCVPPRRHSRRLHEELDRVAL